MTLKDAGPYNSTDLSVEVLGAERGEQEMAKTDLTVNREGLEVQITHVFDAPRDAVWRVFIDPKLIPQWWGPRNLTTIVDKMDVRVGGAWRYVQKDEQGNEYAFNGTYKEIKKPELISDTFNYEPIGPGHELTETARFEEVGSGKTRVTTVSRYKTIADLEGMLQSGMEKGAGETYERLDELLEKVQGGTRMPRGQIGS